MPNETLARRYATAVFQLAQEADKITAVQRDLQAFVASLDAEESVRKFFRSPVVDRAAKTKIVAESFAQLDPIALHTILLLIRKRRENLVEEIVQQYGALERAARGAQTLRIASGRPLSPSARDAIVARLAGAYHTTFDVTESVDPELIGGMRITMGDKRADGTVAGRLDDIARLLSTN